MRRPMIIAVAVAAVAAVTVLAWWKWGGGDGTTSPKVARGVGSAAMTPVGGDRGGGGGDSPGGGDATILVDDDPRGVLRLEGQVIDDRERPVGGAIVVLGSNPPRTATTEGDGAFEFDGLVGRPYTVVARASNGVAGPVTARVTAKTEPVILQLRPAGAVEVTVVTADGKPAVAATVELRGADIQTDDADDAGVAHFDVVIPGGYAVVGWAPGFARSYARIGVDASLARLTLTLRRGAAVSGRVTTAAGAPIAGARVVFDGASDWGTQADPRRDAVISAGDGGFAFDALPAGSFRFVARHAAHAPGTSAIVTLDGATPRTGVEIVLGVGATVAGVVLDTGGKPVAGARVRVGVDGPGLIGEPPRQAYSDDKGAFAITGMPRRALHAVAVHETASSPTAKLDATAGDVTDVELRLDHTGTIAGVVVDPSSVPLEGVQVSATPDFAGRRDRQAIGEWRLRGFPQELTDSSGKFTLTGLAPGSYRVRASRSRAASRGRAWAGQGTAAETGTTDLRIVLEAEGAVTGKVAFADGGAPEAFAVNVGMTQESVVGGDGSFTVDGLPPGDHRVGVRGPTFDGRTVDARVAPGKTTDVGTIVVAKGRAIAGIVVVGGRPVAGATVFAGRQIFGTGSTSEAASGMGPPMARGTRKATTGEDGKFHLAGFGPGDLTIVAEHADVGRSRGVRLVAGDPMSSSLVLELEPFGALTGTLKQDGKVVEGVFVTAQATTSPGAIFSVASGPDGGFRFDRLAPDTYKVSATVGMPMTGMKFYSKQVDVPAGKEVAVELAVDKGAVALAVTPVPATGEVGVASVWLTTGVVAATNGRDLQLRMAAAGPGATQWAILPRGGTATFTELSPGTYTACVVTFPAEIQGMQAMAYVERHGDTLPAFCKQASVKPAPPEQALDVPVTLPAVVPDPPAQP